MKALGVSRAFDSYLLLNGTNTCLLVDFRMIISIRYCVIETLCPNHMLVYEGCVLFSNKQMSTIFNFNKIVNDLDIDSDTPAS